MEDIDGMAFIHFIGTNFFHIWEYSHIFEWQYMFLEENVSQLMQKIYEMM